MRKGTIYVCMLLAILLSCTGLAFAKGQNYVQGVTDDEILIGSLYSVTGPGAYQGLGATQAAELYIKKVNQAGGVHGRKIKFVNEDSGCQPVKGVGAVKKLLSMKPFMLFGPDCSGVALAVIKTIEKEGIPWLTPTASTWKIFIPTRKNVFRMGSFPDNVQAKAVVDFDINQLHARRIAIINDASEYGQGGAEGIIARLKEYGLEPVAKEEVNLGDMDFTTQILKVKEQNPEVVHLYCYAKEAAILVRQAKELGLNTQFILCTAITVPSFLETAADAALGALSVYPSPHLIDSPHPAIANLVKELKANYRIPPGRPSYQELLGYGGMQVVVEGLQRAGRDLTWEKFTKALESIKDFESDFVQPVSFSPDNHNGAQSGKLVVVLPNKKWQVLSADLVVMEKVEHLKAKE